MNAPPKEKPPAAMDGDEGVNRNAGFFTQRRNVNGSGFADGHRVVTVEAAGDFDEPASVLEYATGAERLRWEMRIIALRHIMKEEPRSFAQIAEDLGVTRAALSKIHCEILKAIGAWRDYARAGARMQKGRTS